MNPRKYLIPQCCRRGGDEVEGYIRLKGDRDRSKARGQTVNVSPGALVSECPRRMKKEVLKNPAHHAQDGR